MSINMELVHGYFRNHLQGSVWQGFTETVQSAAVTEAEQDVQNYLGCRTLDGSNTLIFCAICEQAVHLAEAEQRRRSPDSRLQSESVDGLGSRSYRAPSQAAFPEVEPGRLAPRALAFLEHVVGGRGKISRG